MPCTGYFTTQNLVLFWIVDIDLNQSEAGRHSEAHLKPDPHKIHDCNQLEWPLSCKLHHKWFQTWTRMRSEFIRKVLWVCFSRLIHKWNWIINNRVSLRNLDFSSRTCWGLRVEVCKVGLISRAQPAVTLCDVCRKNSRSSPTRKHWPRYKTNGETVENLWLGPNEASQASRGLADAGESEEKLRHVSRIFLWTQHDGVAS